MWGSDVDMDMRYIDVNVRDVDVRSRYVDMRSRDVDMRSGYINMRGRYIDVGGGYIDVRCRYIDMETLGLRFTWLTRWNIARLFLGHRKIPLTFIDVTFSTLSYR
jgi:hypothetical protein